MISHEVERENKRSILCRSLKKTSCDDKNNNLDKSRMLVESTSERYSKSRRRKASKLFWVSFTNTKKDTVKSINAD